MAIYKEDIVTINLEAGSIFRSFKKHTIGTADSAADRFGIRVKRGDDDVDLSGCSCYGYFRDPQGNNIALTSNGTISGNVAYVTLPQACYNYEGQFTLAIKLIGGGVTGTMRIVDGVIDNTNTGSAAAPTGTVPTYSEILSQYDAMVAATAAANGCIAETFDATKAYSAGKYVINSGALYRLTADHAANTTWANTSKVEVKFGNELSDVKSALNQAQLEMVVCESGTFHDPSGDYKVDNNKRIRNVAPVCVDDIFSITVPDDYEMWIFRYDKDIAPISEVGSWKKGIIIVGDVITSATHYINFAIKKTSASTSDISSYVSTVESGIVIYRKTDKNLKDAETDADVLLLTEADEKILSGATAVYETTGSALAYTNDTQGSWIYKDGQWRCPNTSTYYYYHTVDYAVEYGKKYRVTGSENANHPIATFWDSNGNLITSSGDYGASQSKTDSVTMDLAVPKGATIMRVSKFGLDNYPVVYELSVANSVAERTSVLESEMNVLLDDDSVYYAFESGDSMFNSTARMFWSEIVPANSVVSEIKVYVGSLGTGPSLRVELWEIDGDTLTKVFSKSTNNVKANQVNVFKVGYYTDAPLMVCYYKENCNCNYYRSSQSGYSWKYSTTVSADTTELSVSGLSSYSNMKLIGGFTYKKKGTDGINVDFFSGYLSGNIVVFGDSTVDGSSTTGHSDNVIGTDRTASDEPNVYTSILEGMIQTFNGNSSFRVYNGGFGGKTLNYIADNYAAIMAAFSNVKSALIVIDANSASDTRATYASRTRSGLERMITYLQSDGIAVAVASPQPMFYYPADDGTLPAVNSAGEFAIAVNIGKDVCREYGIPFINLGELTNEVMESPYLKTTDFYGDRIHFGDGGHKFEAYELYGELIHPIIYFDGKKTYIPLDSNRCELSASSGISASTVNGYRSIVLQNTHTRTDVLVRFYIIAKVPFKIGGIDADYAYNSDTYVDGVLYQEGVSTMGATIQPGTHEVTIKPESGKIVRFSGLMIESAE